MSAIIAIEGIDGAGTTTQAKILTEGLEAEGVKTLLTREPDDTLPTGRLIRRALAYQGGYQVEPATLALLFAADRIEHHRRVVQPALQDGKVVVTDRSVVSSMAYQTGENKSSWVATINDCCTYPNLTILIDVPVAVCMERLGQREADEPKEIYEFHDQLTAIRVRYLGEMLRLSSALLRSVYVVDGNRPVEDTSAEIAMVVGAYLSYPPNFESRVTL